MNSSEIHFIREIMMTDHRGGQTPRMQFSSDNASYLHPTFVTAAYADEDQLRFLYSRLGGGRAEECDRGPTVVIPNRSFWDNLWSISAEEVRVIPNASAVRTTSRVQGQHLDKWETEERE